MKKMWIALGIPIVVLSTRVAWTAPIQPPAPVALWPFDETGSTNVLDVVGGHNGTVIGANAVRVSGKFGLALDLNNPATGGGTAGNYVTVPDFAYASATGMSVTFWFKVAKNEDGNNDYWYRLIGHGTDGPDLVSAYLYNSSGGTSGKLRLANGGTPAVDTTTLNLNNGQWHHVVMAFTLGVGQKIFVDGAGVLTNASAAALDNPSGLIYFGRASTSGNNGNPGSFDEIAFFDRPLNGDHAAWLWNGGSGNSLSGPVPGILLPVAGSDGGGVSNTFYIGKHEVDSSSYALFLNEAESGNLIGIQSGQVVRAGASDLYCLTAAAAPAAHIRYDSQAEVGTRFSAALGKANHPVIYVSWFGAAAYCNWLSARAGRAPCYAPSNDWTAVSGVSGYRLPTEAEWQKAAAWDKTHGRFLNYGTGSDTLQPADANFLNSGDDGETNAVRTTPVGSYTLASPYNLLDASGNVWEWCHGLYDPAATNAAVDGHVLRGGSWCNLPEDVATAVRIDNPPAAARNSGGFRIVKSQD